MRKTASEKPFPIFLSIAALLGAVILLACAVPSFSAEPAAKPEKAPEVRQPEGSPEAFWNGFGWDDLRPAEQAVWKKLGWNKAAWDEETGIPASENKKWKELSEEERAAASQLGYDEKSWDTTPPDEKKKK